MKTLENINGYDIELETDENKSIIVIKDGKYIPDLGKITELFLELSKYVGGHIESNNDDVILHINEGYNIDMLKNTISNILK